MVGVQTGNHDGVDGTRWRGELDGEQIDAVTVRQRQMEATCTRLLLQQADRRLQARGFQQRARAPSPPR